MCLNIKRTSFMSGLSLIIYYFIWPSTWYLRFSLLTRIHCWIMFLFWTVVFRCTVTLIKTFLSFHICMTSPVNVSMSWVVLTWVLLQFDFIKMFSYELFWIEQKKCSLTHFFSAFQFSEWLHRTLLHVYFRKTIFFVKGWQQQHIAHTHYSFEIIKIVNTTFRRQNQHILARHHKKKMPTFLSMWSIYAYMALINNENDNNSNKIKICKWFVR